MKSYAIERMIDFRISKTAVSPCNDRKNETEAIMIDIENIKLQRLYDAAARSRLITVERQIDDIADILRNFTPAD